MSSSLSTPPTAATYSNPKPPWLRYSQEELKITKTGCFPPLVRHSGDGDYVNTYLLVEVFKVRIDKFDEIERRGELYGKIGVVDLAGPLTLYQRDRKNPEHVCTNCNITLSGPPRAIAVFIGFTITIDLYLCSDCSGSDLEDVVLTRWQLSWDVMDPQVAHIARGHFLRDFSHQPDVLWSQMNCKHQPAGYDRPLSATFDGPNNSCITLYYAILKHAAQASIVVEIIDTNGVPALVEYDVRGAIYASYGHFEFGNDSYIKDDYKTALLKTGTLESVKATRWKSLQLSKGIIAVPAYSSLIIEADLWDTSHLKIAKGKVEFKPHSAGSLGFDYIKGDVDANIAIRVTIRWAFASSIPRSPE